MCMIYIYIYKLTNIHSRETKNGYPENPWDPFHGIPFDWRLLATLQRTHTSFLNGSEHEDPNPSLGIQTNRK